MKKTSWFHYPQRPARIGWYELGAPGIKRWWNGENFVIGKTNSIISAMDKDKWRGLAENLDASHA